MITGPAACIFTQQVRAQASLVMCLVAAPASPVGDGGEVRLHGPASPLQYDQREMILRTVIRGLRCHRVWCSTEIQMDSQRSNIHPSTPHTWAELLSDSNNLVVAKLGRV